MSAASWTFGITHPTNVEPDSSATKCHTTAVCYVGATRGSDFFKSSE